MCLFSSTANRLRATTLVAIISMMAVGAIFSQPRDAESAEGGNLPRCFGKKVTTEGTKGTPGDDVIVGTSEIDVIDGQGGDDKICAKEGADQIRGGSGRDVIRGGTGLDFIDGESGPDKLYGNGGSDGTEGSSRSADRGIGGPLPGILGGPGDDVIGGGSGNDSLIGESGTDDLNGAVGDDGCVDDGVDELGSCENVVLNP